MEADSNGSAWVFHGLMPETGSRRLNCYIDIQI